jgi:trehalose 6-phosphate phosphatase
MTLDMVAPGETFWGAMREHPRRLLMVDYDGTLVGFRTARGDAVLEPSVGEGLAAIAAEGSTRVAVVSGRALQDLAPRLGGLRVHLVGEHGWEERAIDGAEVFYPPQADVIEALQRAAEVAAADGWGPALERKRCSVALHTRGLDPERARWLESRCDALWGGPPHPGLRLVPIWAGRELRANARDKGVAVTGLMAATPGALPVYLGDDDTDEDAFRVVAGRGFGIRVGPALRPTQAALFLESPQAVAGFVERWRREVRGPR